MSGLAAAERLGAEYPFPEDRLAALQFDTYLGVSHGKSRRKFKRRAQPTPFVEPETPVAKAV